MKIIYFIFIILHYIRSCYGVIYKLNDEEYSKMPPVFQLDDYEDCLINPKGIYCTVDIDVVSDTTSELLAMMRNYSNYERKHFNHTQLHRGICVTHTCKHLYDDNVPQDLTLVIEGCLNRTLWAYYQLKCRINTPITCNSNKIYYNKDIGDIAILSLLVLIIIIVCIASVYDMVFFKRNIFQGNRYLLCFSLPRNYSRLLSSYDNLDTREERLKSFHGLRTMTIICVIFCHSLLPFALAPKNPRYIETLYDNILHFLFINGMIVVQTFFIISGCLLAYKIEIYAEQHLISWALIPRAIIATWLKLTPSYAVVLGISMTWLRYAGSGPFWKVAVTKEVDDCRKDGWANILYVNNYLDGTQCLVQSWYLGAIMQMYIVGYVTCIVARSSSRRKVLLALLFTVGILAPAAHTYFQELDAILMVTPETARTFEQNLTFNNVYKRGHTNLVNFVLGLALGFFIYRLQVEKVDVYKFKKYRFLFLLTVPALLGSIFIGSVFYRDGSNASLFVKAVYSGVIKPIYGVILATLIIGCVFKIDNVYRVILEWNGWKIPSKLSYCAFLLHFTIIRIAIGIRTTLLPLSNFNMIQVAVAFITISFIAAVPFWLLIDAPITEFLKICLGFSKFRKITNIAQDTNNEIDLGPSRRISV